MNSQMGFSSKLRRLTAPVCVMIRGELAIGRIFAPHTSHEGGAVKARPYRCRRHLDKKPYWVIGEYSRDVERCLTNRAPVASLVLRPSRSSFSVSLINAY